MNIRESVELLHQYGHFRHPAMPNGWNVGPAVFDLLKPDDRVTRDATASFQEFNGLPVTGDLGPATLALLGAERCGCPDYPDPTAAVGSGSWEMPCQKDGVTVSVDERGCSYVDWLPEILRDVFAGYAAIGFRLKKIDSGIGNIHLTFPVLPGQTIGLAQFPSGSCSDRVFCKLDPGYRPNIRQVKGLLFHEIGHNVGLNHQNRGTDEGHGGHMHSSIREILEFLGWYTFKNDPSLPFLRRYFGGEPLDPVTPPPPPGPNPILDTFTIAGVSYEIRKAGGTVPGPGPFPA